MNNYCISYVASDNTSSWRGAREDESRGKEDSWKPVERPDRTDRSERSDRAERSDRSERRDFAEKDRKYDRTQSIVIYTLPFHMLLKIQSNLSFHNFCCCLEYIKLMAG